MAEMFPVELYHHVTYAEVHSAVYSDGVKCAAQRPVRSDVRYCETTTRVILLTQRHAYMGRKSDLILRLFSSKGNSSRPILLLNSSLQAMATRLLVETWEKCG